MADYLLSNRLYRLPTIQSGALPPEVVNVLWRVQPGFLLAALQTLEREFGGLQNYLEHALGVGAAERQQLAALYLEPRA